MKNTGFSAVQSLVNKGFEWEEVYSAYNSALVEGIKLDEITENFLLERIKSKDTSIIEKKEETVGEEVKGVQVLNLFLEDGYEWDTIYPAYKEAKDSGKSENEITKEVLLEIIQRKLSKVSENTGSLEEPTKTVSSPNYFTNDGKKPNLSASEFAQIQASGGSFYHPLYGEIIQVGAVSIGSYVTWAITADGEMVNIDVRDLSELIPSKEDETKSLN